MAERLITFPVHQRANEQTDAARGGERQYDADMRGFLGVAHRSDGRISGFAQIYDFTEWTDVPYSQNNFTTNAANFVWTMPPKAVQRYRYRIIGKSLRLHVRINGAATLTGTANTQMKIMIPAGYIADEDQIGHIVYHDDAAAGFQDAIYAVDAGKNLIRVLTFGLVNWALTTTQAIHLQVEFKIK